MTPLGLLQAARDTVANPRGAARAVLALELPMSTLWLALALLAVLSTLLTLASLALSPYAGDPALLAMLAQPLLLAGFDLAVLVMSVHLMHTVGKMAGGRGRLAGALALMVWLQVILLIVQAAQLVTQPLVPPLADGIGLVGFAVLVWLLTHFVAELHGFASLGKVLAGLAGTVLGLSLLMALLLAGMMGG